MTDDSSRQSATPLLEVDDLTVSFGGEHGRARVIDGVTFHVDQGEMLAILGESGSGKSVAVRAVMGLLPRATARIERGGVTFMGRLLPRVPDKTTRQLCGTEMGMVFQDSLSALNPVFTVGYQIAELFRLRLGWSRRRADRAAVSALERVGIPDAARRARDYPHEFSGGMRQRVVIAMALALEPRLLIADEPTTALDVTVQAQIMDLIQELRRENGMSVILISHDLGVAAGYADRVSIMYAGRIAETGALRPVYERPAHPYTTGLLESLPSTVEPGSPLRTIEGLPPSVNALPSGCRFHPRCPLQQAICRTDEPALRPMADAGRLSACHFAEEVMAGADH